MNATIESRDGMFVTIRIEGKVPGGKVDTKIEEVRLRRTGKGVRISVDGQQKIIEFCGDISLGNSIIQQINKELGVYE